MTHLSPPSLTPREGVLGGGRELACELGTNYSPSLPKASEASGRRPDHALNVALEGVSRPPTLGPSPGVLLADIGAIIRTPHDVALKGGGG